MSQAVNAWRGLLNAADTANQAEGAAGPSQDIRSTVGIRGVTTVITRPPTCSAPPAAAAGAAAASKAASAARSAAAAADADDDDDGLEVLGEQTLDEVLEVSF